MHISTCFFENLINFIICHTKIELVNYKKHPIGIRIKEICFTGYGCFVYLENNNKILKSDLKMYLSNVDIKCKTNGKLYGSVLYISDGVITELECFPYDSDKWDIDYDNVEFIYNNDF